MGRQERLIQTRLETVYVRSNSVEMISYSLTESNPPPPIIQGTSVGKKIIHGEVCVINNVHELAQFQPGCIIVSEITNPHWVPIICQPAGIVTNHDRKTCHTTIVSFKLGIPDVVNFLILLIIYLSCSMNQCLVFYLYLSTLYT